MVAQRFGRIASIFLVDNVDQVQKTAGFKRLVEEEPTIIRDVMGLIAPRLKKSKSGGG